MPKMWSEGLKSGEYKQANGVLYNKHNDAYCCLGVLENMAGIPFFPDGYDWFEADEMPSGTVRNYCGLDKKLTTEEINFIETEYDPFNGVERNSDRANVLAMFNDEVGLEFDAIADFIVEKGWDVNIDELRENLINEGMPAYG
jgi:hypothetical protein